MAHQIAGRSLWNRKNKQQQGLLISHPRFSDILNNKRPSLVSTIQPASLWPHLRKYNVVGESTQDRITLNSTRSETVEKLLSHVERGPTWHLHSLLRACNLTDQAHIIREVGLDPEMYDGPSPPESDSEDDSHPPVDARVKEPPQLTAGHLLGQQSTPALPSHPQKEGHDVRGHTCTHILLEALTVHSEYYRDNFMMGCVFDFKHHEAGSDFYDIDPCYIQQDVDVQKSKRIADQIKMRDVLRKYGQYSVPKTVLLVGPAGAGKSTFFRRFAFCWSQKLLKYLQNPEVHPCPELSLVVYVQARSLTTDIWDSMERAVICKEDRKSLIINQVKNGQLRHHLTSSNPKLGDEAGTICKTDDQHQHSFDPMSAFLIDGIDEIRDPEVLKALQEFIRQIHQEGGPQILVSARTGLSRLDNSIFNRFLHLEGYTLEQGLDYVQKYITQYNQAEPKENDATSPSTESLQDQNEHPVLRQLRRRNKKIMHILSNPLRAHILSGLTVEGLIELDDDNVLQSVDLLKTMEKFFIKRETEGRGVPEEERNQFYRLCLHGLLEDIREFTEDHLQQFNVSRSAYISFLRKHTKRDKSAELLNYYSFEHELLYEYFGARAIETFSGGMRKAILLYICSRDILRNLQKLIFGMLGEFGTEQSVPLLIGMTQLVLLKEALNNSQKYSRGQSTKSMAKSQNVSEDIEKLHVVSEDNDDQNCVSTLFQSLRRTCCLPGCLTVPSLQSSPHDPPDIEDTAISRNQASGGDLDTETRQPFLQSVQQLFQSIKEGIPAPGDLLRTKEAQDKLDAEAVTAIWEMVEEMFVGLIGFVQGETSQFWKNTYFSIDHTKFIPKGYGFLREVILDLLSELTPEQRELVERNTYLRMLPCNGAYACGDARWLDVHDSRINIWSPTDVADGLRQGRLQVLHREPTQRSAVQTSSGALRRTTNSLDLNFRSTPTQWGCVPDHQWTSAAWDRALQAVTAEYDIQSELEFNLSGCSPADDLLRSISHLDNTAYSGSSIKLRFGHVRLEDLHRWHQSGNGQKRVLTLNETKIHPPVNEQIRKKLLQWVGPYSAYIDEDPADISVFYDVSEYLIINDTK